DDECAALVTASASAWQVATVMTARAFAATALARVDAIAGAIENDGVRSMQPGLFDRRAHFAHAAMKAAHDEALAAQAERRRALRRGAELTAHPPHLRVLLVPRS